MKKILIGILIVLGLFFMLGFCGTGEESTNIPIETEKENTPEVEIEKSEPKLTMGQKNAVRKAESYLKIMAFSRKGLIEQLEYEEFSNEDAVFAVDYINADWNDQAAKKAESYLDIMSFSKQGLADQLDYEGFTSEQISYALEAVGY